MSNNFPPKCPLYYADFVSHLCFAVDRLRRVDSAKDREDALADYHTWRSHPGFDEWGNWVCQRAYEITALRTVPFHFRPDPKEAPWLDWTPALYALYFVTASVDSVLDQPEEWPVVLQNFDGAAMAVECAWELSHLHEKDETVQRHGWVVPDKSSMRPLSRFVDGERFKDIAAVKRFLEKHPEIPTQKAGSQRLNVHAGLFDLALEGEEDRDCQAEKTRSKVLEQHLIREVQEQEDCRRQGAP